MALHLLQRAALTALLLTAVGAVSATTATTALEDDALYNQVLFAGTHNSAINLGAACHGRAPGSGCTLGRPVGAHGGAFSSLSASGGYQVRAEVQISTACGGTIERTCSYRVRLRTVRSLSGGTCTPSATATAFASASSSTPPALPPALPPSLTPFTPFSTSVIPIYLLPTRIPPSSTQSWTNASAFATS